MEEPHNSLEINAKHELTTINDDNWSTSTIAEEAGFVPDSDGIIHDMRLISPECEPDSYLKKVNQYNESIEKRRIRSETMKFLERSQAKSLQSCDIFVNVNNEDEVIDANDFQANIEQIYVDEVITADDFRTAKAKSSSSNSIESRQMLFDDSVTSSPDSFNQVSTPVDEKFNSPEVVDGLGEAEIIQISDHENIKLFNLNQIKSNGSSSNEAESTSDKSESVSKPESIDPAIKEVIELDQSPASSKFESKESISVSELADVINMSNVKEESDFLKINLNFFN